MNIFEFAKNFPTKAEFEKLKLQAIMELDEEITEMVIIQQLLGLDKFDKNIRPEYASAYYAARKQRLNGRPSFGTPDLELTGRMHDKMKMFATTREYDFDSKVDYFQHVKSKYESAFGVSKKNLPRVQSMTTKKMIQLFYDKIRQSD